MKELVDLVNTVKERTFHLTSDCAWWNGELHVPVTERKVIVKRDGSRVPASSTEKHFYCIIRIDCFSDGIITNVAQLIGKVDELEKYLNEYYPENIRVLMDIDNDFNFFQDCYFRVATRIEQRGYRMRDYPEKYVDFKNKPPIEEVSVEEHREIENTFLSLQELADYMECAVYRVKTLRYCPRFPVRKVGRSFKVSLGALNSWIKERKEREYAISDIATGYLIRYLTEKEVKNRTPSKKK